MRTSLLVGSTEDAEVLLECFSKDDEGVRYAEENLQQARRFEQFLRSPVTLSEFRRRVESRQDDDLKRLLLGLTDTGEYSITSEPLDGMTGEQLCFEVGAWVINYVSLLRSK